MNLDIRAFGRFIFWRFPVKLLPLLTQTRYKIKYKYIIRTRKIDGLIELTEKNSSSTVNTINFFHPQRVTRYSMGIQERIDKLLREYCVDQITDLADGVYLDIGSNIGEFSLGISTRFPSARFIRFEPSANECSASKKNLQHCNDTLFQVLLWKEESELVFHLGNETGDSSIFPAGNLKKSVRIQTSTLDKVMNQLSIGMIELIKLEAEGAEPEILLGGQETLEKSRYVVADLGPERGADLEETFESSNRILEQYGFELIGRYELGRKCYLFRNKRFNYY